LTSTKFIRRFDDIGRDDVPLVGAKGASSGGLYRVTRQDCLRVHSGVVGRVCGTADRMLECQS
jgi:phosphoenolpyruvate synthase/pyruvate phosphate dikinase